MWKVIIIYFLVLNIITFICFGVDKLLSKREEKKNGIPESTLLVMAAVGGSIGAIAGIYAWRHKRNDLKFKWGVPAIIVVQLALAIWAWIKL